MPSLVIYRPDEYSAAGSLNVLHQLFVHQGLMSDHAVNRQIGPTGELGGILANDSDANGEALRASSSMTTSGRNEETT